MFTKENPCPTCGHFERTKREVKPLVEMTNDELKVEIVNASSCLSKSKKNGKEETIEAAGIRLANAKAEMASRTADIKAEKEAAKAAVKAEKEAAKAAAKAEKEAVKEAAKAEKEAAKAAAKAAKEAEKAAAKAAKEVAAEAPAAE